MYLNWCSLCPVLGRMKIIVTSIFWTYISYLISVENGCFSFIYFKICPLYTFDLIYLSNLIYKFSYQCMYTHSQTHTHISLCPSVVTADPYSDVSYTNLFHNIVSHCFGDCKCSVGIYRLELWQDWFLPQSSALRLTTQTLRRERAFPMLQFGHQSVGIWP